VEGDAVLGAEMVVNLNKCFLPCPVPIESELGRCASRSFLFHHGEVATL
jgi:hypothetical protein